MVFICILHQHVSVSVVTIFKAPLDKNTINILKHMYKMCVGQLQVYSQIQYGGNF